MQKHEAILLKVLVISDVDGSHQVCLRMQGFGGTPGVRVRVGAIASRFGRILASVASVGMVLTTGRLFAARQKVA